MSKNDSNIVKIKIELDNNEFKKGMEDVKSSFEKSGNAIRKSSQTLRSSMQSAVERLNPSMARLSGTVAQLKPVMEQTAIEAKKAGESFKYLKRNLRSTKRAAVLVRKSMRGLISTIKKFRALAIAGTLAGLAVGLYKVGKASIATAAQMEQYQISLKVMLGSMDKARYLLSEIEKLSIKTPFSPQDLMKSTQTLLSFGVAGNDILETLKMLGDVSGGNKDKFDRLTLAFAQMSATGRLTGQDLLQMINAGFNPLQIISEKTGKSMAQLKKEMEKGAISTKMVVQAFKDATSKGGRFFGMLEAQRETVNGLKSDISKTIKSIYNDIGQMLLPTVKGVLKATLVVTEALRWLTRQARLGIHSIIWGFKLLQFNFYKATGNIQGMTKALKEANELAKEWDSLMGKIKVDLGDGNEIVGKKSDAEIKKEIQEYGQMLAEKEKMIRKSQRIMSSREEQTEEEKLRMAKKYQLEKIEYMKKELIKFGISRRELENVLMYDLYDFDVSRFDKATKGKIKILQEYLNDTRIQTNETTLRINRILKEKFEDRMRSIADLTREVFSTMTDQALTFGEKVRETFRQIGLEIARMMALKGFTSLIDKTGTLGEIGKIGQSILSYDTGHIQPANTGNGARF